MFVVIQFLIKRCNGSSTSLVFRVQLTSNSSACSVVTSTGLCFFVFVLAWVHLSIASCLLRQGTHTPQLSFQAMFCIQSRREFKRTHSCGIWVERAVLRFGGEIKAVGLEKHVMCIYKCIVFPFLFNVWVGVCAL